VWCRRAMIHGWWLGICNWAEAASSLAILSIDSSIGLLDATRHLRRAIRDVRDRVARHTNAWREVGFGGIMGGDRRAMIMVSHAGIDTCEVLDVMRRRWPAVVINARGQEEPTWEMLPDDAAELVQVEYEPLEPVVEAEQALTDHSILHEEAGTNRVWNGVWEYGDVERAFKEAAYVVDIDRLHFHRFSSTPLENNVVIAEWNPKDDRIYYWCNNSFPSFAIQFLAAHLNIHIDKIRVQTFDIGGSFGIKITSYPQMAVCALASKKAGGRPIKWVETRSEHILKEEVDGHRGGPQPGFDDILQGGINAAVVAEVEKPAQRQQNRGGIGRTGRLRKPEVEQGCGDQHAARGQQQPATKKLLVQVIRQPPSGGQTDQAGCAEHEGCDQSRLADRQAVITYQWR